MLFVLCCAALGVELAVGFSFGVPVVVHVSAIVASWVSLLGSSGVVLIEVEVPDG